MNLFNRILYLSITYRSFIGRRMYWIFFLSLMSSLSEAFGIVLLLPLLGVIDGDSPPDTGVERFAYDAIAFVGIESSLTGILFLLGLIFVAKGLLIFLQLGYQGYLYSLLQEELITKLFDAYSRMNYRYYIQRNTGHFINILNEQITRFTLSFKGFAVWINALIMTMGYLVMAFFIAWRFALMAVGIAVILMVLFRILNNYMRTLSRKTSFETGNLNKLLVQALQGFKYISSTNQGGHIRKGVWRSVHHLRQYRVWERLGAALTAAIREPVSVLFIIVIVLVQVLILQGKINTVFVLIILLYRNIGSAVKLQSSWQGVMAMVGSVEMVDNEFKILEQNQEISGTQVISSFSHCIELQNVTFSYDKDQVSALEKVNVRIPKNRTIAIVGQSGSGKSTLIDLLTLLLKPQFGSLRIDGVPSQDVDLRSWRSQIGYVSQETVIFDDTVANNICLWKSDTASDPVLMGSIKKAAQQAHIAEYFETLPNGYLTVVGDRGIRLSGGQRQRLFIARELFKDPSLLILDEATSSLDTESERYIQDSIDALKGKITVVIIAHRLSTIRNADYVYILDQGRVVEEGTYQELSLESESRLGEMIAAQAL